LTIDDLTDITTENRYKLQNIDVINLIRKWISI